MQGVTRNGIGHAERNVMTQFREERGESVGL